MSPKTDALIGLLALTDAVCRPMRRGDWTLPTPAVLWEARKRFAAAGLPWHGSDATEAGRKADQRLLEALAAAGLVVLAGRDRRATARLTELGDQSARSLAGLANVDASHALVREVLRLQTSVDRYGPLCSELWLVGLRRYTTDLDDCAALGVLQERAAPALCRGWLLCRSSGEGRGFYAATDLGRRIAAGPVPELPGGLPEADQQAADLYDSEFIAYRARLRIMRPENPAELGDLPLPASLDIHPRRPGSRNPAARQAGGQVR